MQAMRNSNRIMQPPASLPEWNDCQLISIFPKSKDIVVAPRLVEGMLVLWPAERISTEDSDRITVRWIQASHPKTILPVSSAFGFLRTQDVRTIDNHTLTELAVVADRLSEGSRKLLIHSLRTASQVGIVGDALSSTESAPANPTPYQREQQTETAKAGMSLQALACELNNIQLSYWVDARAHYTAGLQFLSNGKHEEAEKELLRCIEIDPIDHGVCGREALIKLYEEIADEERCEREGFDLRIMRSILCENNDTDPQQAQS